MKGLGASIRTGGQEVGDWLQDDFWKLLCDCASHLSFRSCIHGTKSKRGAARLTARPLSVCVPDAIWPAMQARTQAASP